MMEIATSRQIHEIIDSVLLLDDLEKMRDIDVIIPLSEENNLLLALGYFIRGRYKIETTWNYEKTYEYYLKALTFLSELEINDMESHEQKIVGWLEKIITAHLFLQKAEAAWTLCSFIESQDLYDKAKNLFKDSICKLGQTIPVGFEKHKIYSDAWRALSDGMSSNMVGFQEIRQGSVGKAIINFSLAEGRLKKAIEGFSGLGNVLGAQDAKSYICDIECWKKQKLLTATKIKILWMDYFYFDSQSGFEKIMAYFNKAKVSSPSDLIIPEKYSQEFKRISVDLGTVTIKTKIDDCQLPKIKATLFLLHDYTAMIEYSTFIDGKKDIFSLYLLKILNSGGVPSYEIKFESINGWTDSFEDNNRLHELTEVLLGKLLSTVQDSSKLKYNTSYTMLEVSQFSEPNVNINNLLERYPYFKGLQTASEMMTWMNLPKILKEDFKDIGSEMKVDGIISVSSDSAIFLAPALAEWETQIYMGTLTYLLDLRNIMIKSEYEMESRIGEIKERLSNLRVLIERKKLIGQAQLRELILSNIDIRVYSMKIMDICNHLNMMKSRALSGVSVFVDLASQRIGIPYLISEIDLQVEKIEKLYGTIYEMSQEYLSMTISINSDVSTQAFNILNIIMLGSLGLSILTATRQTPIQLSIASLGVFVTAFAGYTYLRYIKYRVTHISLE
jgi:tetratricopeptide (TPR) repeat protein